MIPFNEGSITIQINGKFPAENCHDSTVLLKGYGVDLLHCFYAELKEIMYRNPAPIN